MESTKVYAVYQDGEVTILTEQEWFDFVEEIRQHEIDEIMSMTSDMVIDTYRPNVLFDTREF